MTYNQILLKIVLTSTLLSLTTLVAAQNHRKIIVFDASNSMKDNSDFNLKLAQDLSAKLINQSQYKSATDSFGLAIFGDYNYNSNRNNCHNIDIVSEGGLNNGSDKERMLKTIREVDARGRTPIVETLAKINKQIPLGPISVTIITDLAKDNSCQEFNCSTIKKIINYKNSSEKRIDVQFIVATGSAANKSKQETDLYKLEECLGSQVLRLPQQSESQPTADTILNRYFPEVPTSGEPTQGSINIATHIESAKFLSPKATQEKPKIIIKNTQGNIVLETYDQYRGSQNIGGYRAFADVFNVFLESKPFDVYENKTSSVSFYFSAPRLQINAKNSDRAISSKIFTWEVENILTGESILLSGNEIDATFYPGRYRVQAKRDEYASDVIEVDAKTNAVTRASVSISGF